MLEIKFKQLLRLGILILRTKFSTFFPHFSLTFVSLLYLCENF